MGAPTIGAMCRAARGPAILPSVRVEQDRVERYGTISQGTRSVIVATSAHRATHAAHEGQHRADHDEDDPQRPQDGDRGDEPDDHQDDAEDDHSLLPYARIM